MNYCCPYSRKIEKQCISKQKNYTQSESTNSNLCFFRYTHKYKVRKLQTFEQQSFHQVVNMMYHPQQRLDFYNTVLHINFTPG